MKIILNIIVFTSLCIAWSNSVKFRRVSRYGCGCPTPYGRLQKVGHYRREGKERTAKYFTCCPQELLAKDYINGTKYYIRWSYAGISDKLSHTTFYSSPLCGGDKLSSTSIDSLDSGTYTCNIVNGSGTVLARRDVTLRVHANNNLYSRAVANTKSSTQYAFIGSNVTLRCSFEYEKNTKSPYLMWRKYFRNSTHYKEFIARLRVKNVHEHQDNMTDGKISGELHLLNITEEHFGNYSCLLKTTDSITSMNISVKHGEHPHVLSSKKEMLILVVVTSSILVFLFFVLFTFRIKGKVIIYLKNMAILKKTLQPGCHKNDVLIIHGEESRSFVFGILVPKLEILKYSTFVPERDIMPGEVTSEVLCNEVACSIRIIIVLTPCLLHSAWAHFTVQQAIRTAIKTSTKILVIKFKNLALKSTFDDSSNFIDLIQFLRHVKCPVTYVPDPVQPILPFKILEPEVFNTNLNCKDYYIDNSPIKSVRHSVNVDGDISLKLEPLSLNIYNIDSVSSTYNTYNSKEKCAELLNIKSCESNKFSGPKLLDPKQCKGLTSSLSFPLLDHHSKMPIDATVRNWKSGTLKTQAIQNMIGTVDSHFNFLNVEEGNSFNDGDNEDIQPCNEVKITLIDEDWKGPQSPMSLCSNSPFLENSSPYENSGMEKKSLMLQIKEFIFGSKEERFWEELQILLGVPLKFKVKKCNEDNLTI